MSNFTKAALAGGATLVTAAGLQGAYKLTGFYPPKPVFWFAIGFTSFLVVNEIQKRALYDQLDANWIAYNQRRAGFAPPRFPGGLGQHPLHPSHPYRRQPAVWGGRTVAY